MKIFCICLCHRIVITAYTRVLLFFFKCLFVSFNIKLFIMRMMMMMMMTTMDCTVNHPKHVSRISQHFSIFIWHEDTGGCKYFNMFQLSLAHNRLIDMSGLSHLTQLSVLNLSFNSISIIQGIVLPPNFCPSAKNTTVLNQCSFC